MDVTQGGSGGRNAWLTVAYAAAKVLLQKFSSQALEEGRRGIGLSIVRGILGGLNFIGVNTRVISSKRPLWVPY